jgi:hypothetical protein
MQGIGIPIRDCYPYRALQLVHSFYRIVKKPSFADGIHLRKNSGRVVIPGLNCEVQEQTRKCLTFDMKIVNPNGLLLVPKQG